MTEIQKQQKTIKIQPQDSGNYSDEAREILSQFLQQHQDNLQENQEAEYLSWHSFFHF